MKKNSKYFNITLRNRVQHSSCARYVKNTKACPVVKPSNTKLYQIH